MTSTAPATQSPDEPRGWTALVLGGSRGIGRATAERLAADGAQVALTYATRSAAADDVVAAIAGRGGRAIALKTDLGRVPDVVQAFDDTEAALGPLDVVVVCGAVGPLARVVDVEPDDFDAVFSVNARGAFFAMREAARRVRDGGRIIALSTAGTALQVTDLALYLGSKGAVEQFTRVLARELGPRGITVNALSPGPTDTELLPDRDREVSPALSPFGRLGTPTDVADVIAFLASPAGGWLTGQNVRATGGVV